MQVRNILKLFFTFTLGLYLTACSENNEEPFNEYANWTQRNDSAFFAVLNEASTAINEARLRYGNQWEQYTQWRIYTNWRKPAGALLQASDSVPVFVEVQGKGKICPLYSDSVHVNYLGRLVPTPLHLQGFVFDHSGTSENEDIIFSPQLCSPSLFGAGSNIVGFSTAILYMHVGDKWRFYIHPDLAYGENDLAKIPAHSMLCFTAELKAIYRSGIRVENW